jgi:hypothetical protein
VLQRIDHCPRLFGRNVDADQSIVQCEQSS